jgi:hypothetical protein
VGEGEEGGERPYIHHNDLITVGALRQTDEQQTFALTPNQYSWHNFHPGSEELIIFRGKIKLILKIEFRQIGSGVYSASNRNEYQKHKNNNVSGE